MATSQTIIIGAGPAGLAAAICASAAGQRVLLLEGNQEIGRKILASGNGRCNLTNLDADSPTHYHGGRPRFVEPALGGFPVEQTLEFLRDLGLETREEKRRRLFPLSDQARSVVDVLEDRLNALGVEVALGTRVSSLAATSPGFVLSTSQGQQLSAERVILATGGVSAPKLGADASGMDLAAGLGHTRTDLLPGLVPLRSPDPWVRRMQGVRVRATVTARVAGQRAIVDTDDLLFTRYGVSGFAILNVSTRIVPALQRSPVELEINLFPGSTPEEISELLQARWRRNPHRSLELSFAGLLHNRVCVPLLDMLGLSGDRPVTKMTRAQRWLLAQTLTAWRVKVTEAHSFEVAEVTIGGIRTEEIDPESLQSHIVPGLYFAGEMVDIHGDLGGFNFQWAWSSGHLAGLGRGI